MRSLLTTSLVTAALAAGCSGSAFLGAGNEEGGASGSSSGVSSGDPTSGSATGASTGGASGSASTGAVSSGAGSSGTGGSSGTLSSGGGSGSTTSGTASSGKGGSGASSSGTGGSGTASSGIASSGTGGTVDAGAPCSTSSDCGAREICGFPASEGCSAKGQCFADPGVTCQAIALGCACDGSMINIACNGLPDGYETKPFLHDGACTNDVGDGGGSDAGKCCPVGYDLYSCSLNAGGTAQACHNPALGCPSSLTCGVGCDYITTGRCVP